jgi:hypothetical protein
MRERHGLGVFEDRVLIEVFGHRGVKQEEVEKTA